MLALAASDSLRHAEATSWRASDADPAAVAREAAEKAERTRGATTIEPQTFRAVLEPYAISGASLLLRLHLAQRTGSPRGRSYLSGRLGEKLFDESFTLWDEGLDPRNYQAFDLEAFPSSAC